MNDTTTHVLPDETANDFAVSMAEGLRMVAETARQLLPAAIDAIVPLAYLPAEDPTSVRARKRARAMLVRNGLATAQELETLPEGTIKEVALERLLAGGGRAQISHRALPIADHFPTQGGSSR